MTKKFNGDRKTICQLYADGLSSESIGKLYGVSKQPIKRILAEAGINVRRSNIILNEEEKRSLTISLYKGGRSIPEIMDVTGVGKNSTSRFLREAGILMRTSAAYGSNINSKAMFDVARAGSLYSSGWTIAQLVREFGLGFGTIQRHLTENGVEMRPVSSVPTFTIDSPCAGKIRVRGTWEAMYAQVLDIWHSEGKIVDWGYEREKVFLPELDGRYYLPDFTVVTTDNVKAFHEVKGRLFPESFKKIQLARNMGVSVVMIRRPLITALQNHYRERLAGGLLSSS